MRRLQQGFRADIEKQQAIQGQFAKGLAGLLAGGDFQFGQATGLARGGVEGQGGLQRSIGGAADERS